MGTAAIIAGILGLISAFVNIGLNANNNVEARARASEADQRQFENQKKLMDYEAELAKTQNPYSTAKGHMVEAGYSPALMYGSSPVVQSISGGSAQGSVADTIPLGLFDKLAPKDMVEAYLGNRSQIMKESGVAAQNNYYEAAATNQLSQAAENSRDTKLKNELHDVLIDTAYANLNRQKAEADNLYASTMRTNMLLPGELAQQGAITEHTRSQIDYVHSQIEHNTELNREIRANIKYLSTAAGVNDSRIALNEAEKFQVIESVKNSQLTRIMKEFGLDGRQLAPSLLRRGAVQDFMSWANAPQTKGAYIELRNLGFSEHEAACAVLYYSVPNNQKDIGPSVVNAASRALSAVILKK